MSLALHEQLLYVPHHRTRELLATGLPVHVLVNPVEYHGPHLSLGNDRILSERIARRLHTRLNTARGENHPFLVGGVIDFGSDPTPGDGSVGITYTQLAKLVTGVCDGLIALGARRVIFHTFHGSPFHCHAIHAGIDRLAKAGIPSLSVFDLLLNAVVNYDEAHFRGLRDTLDDPADFDIVFPRLPFDLHAGFFETSVALDVAPDTVSDIYRTLPPCPDLDVPAPLKPVTKLLGGLPALAREIEHTSVAMAWMKLKPFPGYTSYPSLATPEAGKFFVEQLILPLYEEGCQQVLWGRGQAPKAQFQWLRPVAGVLGGRI